jgi:hypothetical protein
MRGIGLDRQDYTIGRLLSSDIHIQFKNQNAIEDSCIIYSNVVNRFITISQINFEESLRKDSVDPIKIKENLSSQILRHISMRTNAQSEIIRFQERQCS